MKEIYALLRGLPRNGVIAAGYGIVLINFCLVLSLVWYCSCVLAPAALVSSAAVSAAAILAEVEGLAQDGGNSDFVTVPAETDVYEGPGKSYPLKGALKKGDELKVLGVTEGWVLCFSDQFAIGWVQQSNVPK